MNKWKYYFDKYPLSSIKNQLNYWFYNKFGCPNQIQNRRNFLSNIHPMMCCYSYESEYIDVKQKDGAELFDWKKMFSLAGRIITFFVTTIWSFLRSAPDLKHCSHGECNYLNRIFIFLPEYQNVPWIFYGVIVLLKMLVFCVVL